MTASHLTKVAAARAAALLRVRWIVRAPIWLYRARLGFLFGPRLLMLEHIGRTSGQRRYVVLEVVARPAPDSFVVASGFGTRAQWYRNVVANPRVRIYVGGHRPATATATVLTTEKSTIALTAYASAHPRAWRTLKPVFETTLGDKISGGSTNLPLVALDRDASQQHNGTARQIHPLNDAHPQHHAAALMAQTRLARREPVVDPG